MLWTTINSIELPGGRASKLGESTRLTPASQPSAPTIT